MVITTGLGSNNFENSSSPEDKKFSTIQKEAKTLKQSIETQGGPIEIVDVKSKAQLDEMMNDQTGRVYLVELWGENCNGCKQMYNPSNRTGNIQGAKLTMKSQGYTSDQVKILRLQITSANPQTGMPYDIQSHTGWRDGLGNDFGEAQYKILPGMVVVQNGVLTSSDGMLDTDDIIQRITSNIDMQETYTLDDEEYEFDENVGVTDTQTDTSTTTILSDELEEEDLEAEVQTQASIDAHNQALQDKVTELTQAQEASEEEKQQLQDEIAVLQKQIEEMIATKQNPTPSVDAPAPVVVTPEVAEVIADSNYPLVNATVTDDIGALAHFRRGKGGRLYIRTEQGNKIKSGSMFLTPDQKKLLHASQQVKVNHRSLDRMFIFELKNGKLAIKVVVDESDATKALDTAKKNMEAQKITPAGTQEAVSGNALLLDEMEGIDAKIYSKTWVIPEHWDLDQENNKKRFGLRDGDPMKGVLAISRENEGSLRFDQDILLNIHGININDPHPKKVEFMRREKNTQRNPLAREMTKDHIFVSYALDPKTKEIQVTIEPSQELRDYYDGVEKEEAAYEALETPVLIDGIEVKGVSMSIPGIEDDDLDIDIPDLRLSKDADKIVDGNFMGVHIHNYYRRGIMSKDKDYLGDLSWTDGSVDLFVNNEKEIREKPLTITSYIEDGILHFEWVLDSGADDGDGETNEDEEDLEGDEDQGEIGDSDGESAEAGTAIVPMSLNGIDINKVSKKIRGLDGYETRFFIQADGVPTIAIYDTDVTYLSRRENVEYSLSPEMIWQGPISLFFDGEYIDEIGLLVPEMKNGVLSFAMIDAGNQEEEVVEEDQIDRPALIVENPSRIMKSLGIEKIAQFVPLLPNQTTSRLEIFLEGDKVKVRAEENKSWGKYWGDPLYTLFEQNIAPMMRHGTVLETKKLGIGKKDLVLKWKIKNGLLSFYRERPLSKQILDAREAFGEQTQNLPFDPDAGHYVSSEYGATEEFRDGPHRGIDIGNMPVGSEVRAVAAGTIEIKTNGGGIDTGYGRYAIIKHPNGYETWYGHLHPSVTIDNIVDRDPNTDGVQVNASDNIGVSGNSGSSSGPHLDFSLRDSRNPKVLTIDPGLVFTNLATMDRKEGIQPKESILSQAQAPESQVQILAKRAGEIVQTAEQFSHATGFDKLERDTTTAWITRQWRFTVDGDMLSILPWDTSSDQDQGSKIIPISYIRDGDLTSINIEGVNFDIAIDGNRLLLKSSGNFEGIASVYDQENGKMPAYQKKYKNTDFVAAHQFLPPGTKVKVSREGRGEVEVTIVERGPYKKQEKDYADGGHVGHYRMVDLSYAAGYELGLCTKNGESTDGVGDVTMEVIEIPQE